MGKIVSVVVAAAMLTSSTAQAANMATMSGVVRVNQGSGYQTASRQAEVNPGDLVMVSPGGLALVSYSCGLTENVAPGAVYTVGNDARKCSKANVAQAQANVADGPKPMLFHGGGGSPFGIVHIVTIGALIAGIGWLVDWCRSDNKSRFVPSSP